jgi:hypothetical protein
VLARLLVGAGAIVFAFFVLFPSWRWEADGFGYGEARMFTLSPESLEKGTELIPARLQIREWVAESGTALAVTVLFAIAFRRTRRSET